MKLVISLPLLMAFVCAQPVQTLDLNPGPGSSSIIQLMPAGSNLYFICGSNALCRTSTRSATVTEITDALGHSFLVYSNPWVDAGEAFYFLAQDSFFRPALWRVGHGSVIAEPVFLPLGHRFNGGYFGALGGSVYFWATGSDSKEAFLYRVTSRSNVGELVRSVSDETALTSPFLNAGDRLLFAFAGDVSQTSRGFWVTDGTAMGTRRVFQPCSDAQQFFHHAFPDPLFDRLAGLYFNGSTYLFAFCSSPSFQNSLYKLSPDLREAETVVSLGPSFPSRIDVGTNRFSFTMTANDPFFRVGASYVSDGTAAGTIVSPYQFAAPFANSVLRFGPFRSDWDNLIRTNLDGTGSLALLGAFSQYYMNDIYTSGSFVLFDGLGRRYCRSNGDVNDLICMASTFSTGGGLRALVGNRLYFVASEPSTGQELRYWDLPARQPLRVTISPPGAGRVVAPFSLDDAYEHGRAVQLNAIPASGFTFAGYGGDLAGAGPTQSLVMDRPRNVTANFVPLANPAITVTAAGSGNSGANRYYDLQLRNTGGGAATAVTLNSIQAQALAGTGAITPVTMFPLQAGALAPQASTTVRVVLNVPATVVRFRFSVNGTAANASGVPLSFSSALALPR